MSHLISKPTTETTCPRCRTATLSGIDEGIPARVDRAPLATQAAEIAALVDNRRTFTHTANRFLIYRDASRIAGGQLNGRGTVHAEHKCTGQVQLTIDEMIGHQ